MNYKICVEGKISWNWSQPRGRAGGILVGINNDSFDIVNVEIGIYFIRTLLLDKKGKFEWNLVIVYGDAQNAGKVAYLAELSRVYQDNVVVPCVMGDDFNIIRNSSEKNKPIGDATGTLFLIPLLSRQDWETCL